MRATPELRLSTLYALNGAGRITSTLEPIPRHGPKFTLLRSSTACAWAVHAELAQEVALELLRLASEEPPTSDLRAPPLHADRYRELVEGQAYGGPAFEFPDSLRGFGDVVLVDDFGVISRNFRGWTRHEIAERAPILAVVQNGAAISQCFCARRTNTAAEAGLETAPAFRGRGLAVHVTSAWALAIRASGRIPIYSTSWGNTASLAVAQKLALVPWGNDWSII